ncbi:hypothetical protein [Phytohalomonas tamaricis]|uniref:hypothetical protein n=1 Tax=Phytohalomonas tamaricis TaxID=2081032 RepID=UPI000D0BB7E1|nr:hypothetical protein [Phytohalomonas tamaricis]
MASKKQVVAVLMSRHGRTFSNELGIDLHKNTPSPLFRLLCFALLSSARIDAQLAMSASKSLAQKGWTTVSKMHQSTWEERVQVLHQAGYTRLQEKTATQLGELTDKLLDDYDGDLRKLREAAQGKPKKIRKHLKTFKGIGETGANIFLREVQLVWEECYPFADKPALKAAEALKLGKNAEKLASRVEQNHYPRLIASLVRAQLSNSLDDVREAAKNSESKKVSIT